MAQNQSLDVQSWWRQTAQKVAAVISMKGSSTKSYESDNLTIMLILGKSVTLNLNKLHLSMRFDSI